MQVGDHQDIAARFDMGWKADIGGVHADRLAFESGILQPIIGTVGDYDHGVSASSIINPDSVGCFILTRFGTSSAKGLKPFPIAAVVVNVIGSIAIGHIKTTIGMKCNIGRRKAGIGLVLDVRFRGFIFSPDFFTLQVGFLDHINREHISQIEIFLAPFHPNIDTVSTSMKFLAK